MYTGHILHAKVKEMKTFNAGKRMSTGQQYFFSTVILFFFISLLYTVQDIIGYETVSMILLLIIFMLPLFNFSRGPIILSAVISALGWDYYFIPPHFTMHIAKPEDVMMLLMFLVVALTNGVLTAKLNVYKYDLLKVERRWKSLYSLVKELSGSKDTNEVLEIAVKNIEKIFHLETVIFLNNGEMQLSRTPHPSGSFIPDEMEWLAAEAAFKQKSSGGSTTDLVGNADAYYYPVIDKGGTVVCMIGIKLNEEIKKDKEEMKFLRDFIDEITTFVERTRVYSRP